MKDGRRGGIQVPNDLGQGEKEDEFVSLIAGLTEKPKIVLTI